MLCCDNLGYSGTFCETFTFTCTLFSCQNGGRCLLNELGQGTICSCPIPYAGENCTDRKLAYVKMQSLCVHTEITFETPMFDSQSYIEIRATK